MPILSNERLCKLAQAGDTAARDILLEKNLGFIRKIALEQYRSMGLDENDIGIDLFGAGGKYRPAERDPFV